MENYIQPIWVIISGIAALLNFIPIFELYYKIGGIKIKADDTLENTELKKGLMDESVSLSLVLTVIAVGTMERFLFLNLKGNELLIQMLLAPFLEMAIIFFSAKYLGLKQRKKKPFNWN